MIQGRWEGFRIMEKLRILKGLLRVWNKEVFGDIRIKKEIIAKIDKIDAFLLEGPFDYGLIEERFSLKRNLEEVIRKDNVRWYQKFKIKWAKERNCNTGFFFIEWLMEEGTRIILVFCF